MNRSTLALIPARGGSKRLPRKNIVPFAGTPLIGWTIQAAKECKFIDHVLVSTDDQEIASIANNMKAKVPFLRPAELSNDTANSFSVAKHAIEWWKNNNNESIDTLILLQPTSPLRTSQDICSGLDLYIQKNADAVIGVCEVEHSPLWCNVLPSDGNMNNFIHKDIRGKRSQDLPKNYRINGALYIYNVQKLLLEEEFFFNEKTYAYRMSVEHSIDIDTIMDLRIAEVIYNLSRNEI